MTQEPVPPQCRAAAGNEADGGDFVDMLGPPPWWCCWAVTPSLRGPTTGSHFPVCGCQQSGEGFGGDLEVLQLQLELDVLGLEVHAVLVRAVANRGRRTTLMMMMMQV